MRTGFSAFIALIVTIFIVAMLAMALELRVHEPHGAAQVGSPVSDGEPANLSPLEQLMQAIGDSRHCSVDTDCMIATFGCPLDCYAPIAVSQLGSLNTQFDSLRLGESWSCAYWCVGVPEHARAACVDGICEMPIGGLPDEFKRPVETVPMLLLDASREAQRVRVHGFLRRHNGITVLFANREACLERDTRGTWLEIRSYLKPPGDDRRWLCRRTMVVGHYEHGPILIWGAGEAAGRMHDVTYFRLDPLLID